MTLELLYKSSRLSVQSGTRLSLTYTNPIFDTEGVARGYSFPFTIPTDPHNLLQLNFPNRLDLRTQTRKEEAQLILQGVPVDKGIVQVTGASQERIELVFKNIPRDILDQMEEIKINEILETIAIPYTGAAQWTLDFLPGKGFYQLQIDSNFYQDSRDIALETIVQDMTIAINQDYPGFAFYDIFSPHQLKLNINLYPNAYIPFQMIVGIELQAGSTISQDKHQSFQDFIDTLVANPSEAIFFPVVYAPNFYGGQNPAFKNYLNYYHGGSFIDNTGQDEKTWEHTWVPFIRIPYILQKIGEALGYSWGGDLWELQDFQQLGLYTGYALDEVIQDDFGIGPKWYNRYQQQIPLNDMVPEMTAREFLAKLGVFNFYLDIDGSTILLKNRISPLRQPPIDWTKKAEPAYSIDIPDKEGFKLQYEELDQEVIKNFMQLQAYGDGDNTTTFPIFPLYYLDWFDTLTSSLWRILHTSAEGSSPEAGQQEAGFRLAFDRGYVNDREDIPYFYGAVTAVDSKGDPLGILSLQLEGADGIYEQLWKGYIELADTPTISKTLELSIADIIETKKWTNAVRKIYHREGTLFAIIKSIKVTATPEGLLLTQVEFIQQQ